MLKQRPMLQADLFSSDASFLSQEEPYLFLERRLWKDGFCRIGGVDEAGRGPLAGPVVACACILPGKKRIPTIFDSKALLPDDRKKAFTALTENPKVIFAVGIVDHEMIDKINILRATLLAMKQAIDKLKKKPDFILIDGRDSPPLGIPHQAIIKGDSLSQSIAAASIIAKEWRDAIMVQYDAQFPEWNFKEHKGYATAAHLAAIEKHGISPIHRKTFAPVTKVADKQSLTLF